MTKPANVFNRDHEWQALNRFVSGSKPGATFGLVYGRRRQVLRLVRVSREARRVTFLVQTTRRSHRGQHTG